jgi:hypothetical protein
VLNRIYRGTPAVASVGFSSWGESLGPVLMHIFTAHERLTIQLVSYATPAHTVRGLKQFLQATQYRGIPPFAASRRQGRNPPPARFRHFTAITGFPAPDATGPWVLIASLQAPARANLLQLTFMRRFFAEVNRKIRTLFASDSATYKRRLRRSPLYLLPTELPL